MLAFSDCGPGSAVRISKRIENNNKLNNNSNNNNIIINNKKKNYNSIIMHGVCYMKMIFVTCLKTNVMQLFVLLT